ncbi:MAG: efflux RND transporter permease subunit [Vulcanimicrobiaceae bacterium]
MLALLGVHAYLVTPQSIFPTMSFSRIDVVADAGDLPPDQVRVAVTQPLERAFEALPAVTKVYATSAQGSAELIVDFTSSTDPHVDLQYVNGAISQLRPSLGATTGIVAVIINPDSEPVLSYAFSSPVLSPALLRQLVEYQIVPPLYGIPGLGRLLVTGGPQTEFHVILAPAALAAHRLSAADVSRALGAQNQVRAVGIAEQYYQRYALVLDSSLRDVASLERVQIPVGGGATVPLGSLGTIAPGVGPVTDQTSIGATRAVVLNAYALPGADTVAMAREFRARLRGLQAHLPSDVKLTKFWDQTTLIVESQSALRDAIMIGAALAILVIFLFLRDLRLTLVAATVIPLAMAIAVFALQLAGQTLNLMSVGGLAVAVGLIIDDAIVVIENVARNLRMNPERPVRETIELATSQLIAAMTASTASTVVVFLPLALLGGVTGFFFRALAFTLAAALIVSLGLAIFVAPNLARVLLRARQADAPHHDAVGALLERYDPVLRWALGHRRTVYLGSFAVLLVTVAILRSLPSSFLPSMDEGQFEIGYALPPGTSLRASDAAAMHMATIVAADSVVATVGRLTGVDSNGYSPTPVNKGLLRVRLIAANRRPPYPIVSDRLRARLEAAVPSARFNFHQILEDMINDLSGTPAPVEIEVFGTDQQVLIRLADRIARRISAVHGIVDVASGIIYGSPSLRIAPRGAALARLGLGPGDVGDALASLAQGQVATSVPGPHALIPVRVLVAGAGTAPPDALGSRSLLAGGAATALGSLADVRTQRLSTELFAINGQPLVRVTANIAGVPLSTVTAGLERVLREVAFPPGYRAVIGGQARTQAQSFREFLGVIAIAIALVFAVMLATFKSFRLPLVIITAIPLALIGVALALLVTRTPFNVSSFMGLLLLVGLVVKNGILLIDVANKHLAEGKRVESALLAAGRTRLRPIVMTTLAAIGGLLPLALGIGQGSEMERPLAIAVIGGLSTATVFTLIVIPVLFAGFMGRAPASRASERAA